MPEKKNHTVIDTFQSWNWRFNINKNKCGCTIKNTSIIIRDILAL